VMSRSLDRIIGLASTVAVGGVVLALFSRYWTIK